MHEMSIAMALIEQMEQVAREQKARAIPKVTVTIGSLAGVDAEALRAVFELAAETSVAAGAVLEIEPVQAAVLCRGCGKETVPEPPFLCCGACGGAEVEVVRGRELYIKAMEIETDS